MASVTKEYALAIARKLGATIDTRNKAHDIATVYENGQLVAVFGIRRGSSKDLGHPHIPEAIYLNRHRTIQLAQCHISREEWIATLADRGII